MHGGNIIKAAKEYGLKQEEIIDFSANINFLGLPSSAKKVIQDNLAGIENYPEPNSLELKHALADKLNLKERNLIVSNGAVELIYLIAKVLKPKNALVLAPTFSEYRLSVESIGGRVEEFQLRREEDFELNIVELLPKIAKVDLFFLCNPNNPTAKFITRSEIIKILDYGIKNNSFIVIDEAFIDFLEEDLTVIDLVEEYNNLLVLRSLTKFFAIPGLRLGYGATNSKLISKLEQSKDPWNVNSLAQKVGRTVINDTKYILETKKMIREEKDFLYNKLSEMAELKAYYPSANYILIDLNCAKYSASEIEDKLAKEGILIRNCNNYSNLGEDFIRVAVKSREDNIKLVAKLFNIL
ncbi:threonine-phosphate decarboxylase CobD [Orenia marismortui]|uniref:threonine-phosphate decarboxylase n=1 Tax=Orenia marismortui TaxID=46469 RepID=A0A4R8HAM7_9FIRM|nr:threonine-phosphate decarboxylase CobD [Orenia marismortui]TDX52985.1 L-threonine O-3-phosphate decarboxylase [Orenia marismortui]